MILCAGILLRAKVITKFQHFIYFGMSFYTNMDLVCSDAINVALKEMVPVRQISAPSITQVPQGAGAGIGYIVVVHDNEYIDLRFGRQIWD